MKTNDDKIRDEKSNTILSSKNISIIIKTDKYEYYKYQTR